MFLESLAQNISVQELAYWKQYTHWAALLHEIGIDIAHTGYHKHSAYIIGQADMPGFSRKEQGIMSTLVCGQRGDLRKMLTLVGDNSIMWFAILSLRLAVLLNRSRLPITLPPFTSLRHHENSNTFVLRINQAWLNENLLAASALEYEAEQWSKINMPFMVQAI